MTNSESCEQLLKSNLAAKSRLNTDNHVLNTSYYH